tara:strand:- start:863 stop:1498 length:636 start_codon:yes stop_codon:yes gene_type:complete
MKYKYMLDKSVRDNIRNMNFGKTNKTWEIIGDLKWEHMIPPPPENDSQFTRKEIEFMVDLTEQRDEQGDILVKVVDEDPNNLFDPELVKKHKKEFEKAWSFVKPVIMNLKWKWNRPRPYQLSDHFGYKINVLSTKSHHTPAYPSGHTAWAATMGHILQSYYPNLRDQIQEKVLMAGQARVLQGVHYPSDNDASIVVTQSIWNQIHNKIIGV